MVEDIDVVDSKSSMSVPELNRMVGDVKEKEAK